IAIDGQRGAGCHAKKVDIQPVAAGRGGRDIPFDVGNVIGEGVVIGPAAGGRADALPIGGEGGVPAGAQGGLVHVVDYAHDVVGAFELNRVAPAPIPAVGQERVPIGFSRDIRRPGGDVEIPVC